ncbi:DUF429 domain-containing protein [Piscinibacter sp. XHJ-5]|uniref:DUF429 domain-containing protein n=1 Tax=Piscinibacter sp. XHJ-5 TaxID=3037797 RepID=UPI002452F8CF|nr:DUF429 domain-containing protein [Piscinibacter sp. XHJ-5]
MSKFFHPTHAVAGVDFTSRPTQRKPITVALGHREGRVVHLQRLAAHDSFEGFGTWLRTPGPWIAAIDMPFGLPRELVTTLGWPTEWLPLMRHYTALSRPQIRTQFAAFCAARPVGGKFAHRACDAPAGSSPSMKWVNPPVAYMLHAGVPLLIEAGVHLPAVHAGDPLRVALEAYPGLLAREILGRRSYKSDETARQTAQRLAARRELVDFLEAGRTRLGLELRLSEPQRESLLADASGDRLDAVLCMLQAAWASGQPGHGVPSGVDPLEGWITSA